MTINVDNIGNNVFGKNVDSVKYSKRVQNFVAILVILIFAGINISSVRRGFSLTTDEDKHYLYGEHILAGNPSRFNPSTMPATALNALPKRISSFLDDGRIKNILSRYSLARSITIFFSCLIAYFIFCWARLLYGFIPALFSLVLYVLDPNIIAHSQLVTTDVYVTGSMAFAFYTLWRFARERTTQNGLLCLFALGVSQLTKYTAIVLFPLFFLTLLSFDLSSWKKLLIKMEDVKHFLFRYVRYAGLAFLALILIINIGFLFSRTFRYFGEYNFRSDLLKKIQSGVPVLYFFPVPVPEPYLSGLDYMSNVDESGSAEGNNYLLGAVRTEWGFPGYYFIASILKVPISTQIILTLAILVYFSRQGLRTFFLQDEFFLLVPVVFFSIYFNFFFNTQVGIRYYLPVFPFLYIFSGSLFVGWEMFSKVKKMISLVLLAYLSVSVFSYHPYYLSYFNEIVWNRMDAYKYLADSNVDWGQGKNELDQYLSTHPGALYHPNRVRSGRLVIRINDLVGVTQNPEKYAWLRDNFEPVEEIAYSYLVYKISQEEIEVLCATTSYCDK